MLEIVEERRNQEQNLMTKFNMHMLENSTLMTCCSWSVLMTGNKTSFIELDESVKKVIKFADGRHITSGGKGNIFVVRNDGRKGSIIDVLYVPSMTSNLISICKLLAKG